MAHQKERLVHIPLLQPVQRKIRDQIRAIPRILLPPRRRNELRIVVRALPGQDVPVVKSRRIVLQMPLADLRVEQPDPVATAWVQPLDAHRYAVLPLRYDGSVLTVAVIDPLDFAMVYFLETLPVVQVNLQVAPAAEVRTIGGGRDGGNHHGRGPGTESGAAAGARRPGGPGWFRTG